MVGKSKIFHLIGFSMVDLPFIYHLIDLWNHLNLRMRPYQVLRSVFIFLLATKLLGRLQYVLRPDVVTCCNYPGGDSKNIRNVIRVFHGIPSVYQ